jgi:transcriptional repressor NrdR
VESEIYADYFAEVPAAMIGEVLMPLLKKLDQVAYVRFASIYREFKDVNDFMQEVQPMLNRKKPKSKPRR